MSIQKGLELVNSVKSVSRETEERLTAYFNLLHQWQSKINLISPKTIDQIWERHIADSLQCVDLIDGAKSIIDIGSGAGFPGMVMAIAMADEGPTHFDFIESNGKKCAFLNAVVRETGLNQSDAKIQVHHGRIQDILSTLTTPDVICARALASLTDLLKLTSKTLQNGGIGVFSKGRDHALEIKEAEKAWSFQFEMYESKINQESVILKISDVNPR